MNYAELKANLFAALEKKTSFGRNELKEIINDVFLAAADKEIALLDPKQPKDYVVDDTYDGDVNLPWS